MEHLARTIKDRVRVDSKTSRYDINSEPNQAAVKMLVVLKYLKYLVLSDEGKISKLVQK
jgi:hypothetical protein